MAYDDEKKEREKIKKKIKDLEKNKKELEKENDKLSDKKKYAKDNIECFEKKEMYENILKQLNTSDGAQKDLADAIEALNKSHTSYKNNLGGNAGKTKDSTYNSVRDELINIKTNVLAQAWSSASAGKAGIVSRIKSNNSKIGETTRKYCRM